MIFLYAKIIKASYEYSGCEFFTRVEDEMQFGVISYCADYKTDAHCHSSRRFYQRNERNSYCKRRFCKN